MEYVGGMFLSAVECSMVTDQYGEIIAIQLTLLSTPGTGLVQALIPSAVCVS